MKKRKVEILITAFLSLFIWMYYYLNSIPLTRGETILIVGVVLVITFSIGSIIKSKSKKKDEKS